MILLLFILACICIIFLVNVIFHLISFSFLITVLVSMIAGFIIGIIIMAHGLKDSFNLGGW